MTGSDDRQAGKVNKWSQPTRSAELIKPVKSSKPVELALAASNEQDGIGDTGKTSRISDNSTAQAIPTSSTSTAVTCTKCSDVTKTIQVSANWPRHMMGHSPAMHASQASSTAM